MAEGAGGATATKPPVTGRPPVIARREAKRQAKLAQQRPAPDPAAVLTQHEYCWIKGFHSWSELPVPIHVLLIRERYADGHCQEWALMTTRSYADPPQARTDYHSRVKIEERHRQLKCFHDLSDFQSRAQNVMVAQVVFILLSYTLRQWQLWRLHAEVSPDQTPELMRRRWPGDGNSDRTPPASSPSFAPSPLAGLRGSLRAGRRSLGMV